VLLELAPVLAEVAAATVFSAEAALEAPKRLDRVEAWLLLTLPIDIMTPIETAVIRSYRPEFEKLEENSLSAVERRSVRLTRTSLQIKAPELPDERVTEAMMR
jgi:hypothetical protein